MAKILVKIEVPIIEKEYEVWLPKNRKVNSTIKLLTKAINELSGGIYNPKYSPIFYNKNNGKAYEMGVKIKDTDLKNGSIVIMV